MEGSLLDDKDCCGTCKYHKFEDIDNGFVCVNSDSEYVTDWTEYDFYCDEYKRR